MQKQIFVARQFGRRLASLEDGGELWVLEELVFCGGSSVMAPCSPVRFRSFTRHLVQSHAQPATRKQGPRRPAVLSLREQLLDEFPWLSAQDLDVDYERPAEEEDGNEGEQEGEEEVVIDEEEHDRIRQEILEVRAEYRLEDEDKFFYVRQRGGDANVPKVGRALDCAAMFARTGVATHFCVRYGFPKQKSYHYSKYGGEAPANHLIKEFARKGHYFCCLWVSHDCDDAYVFVQEDIDSFEQGSDFVDCMLLLPVLSDTFAAGMVIVDWRPRV